MGIADSPHGGNLARAALEYGHSEKELLDFSANINPLGPPPGVYSAVMEEFWRVRHYPDPDCGVLTQLLADYLGVTRENLIVGNGGAELIYLLPRVLRLERVLVVAPTFSEYAEAVKANGGEVTYVTVPPGEEIFPAEKIAGQLPGCDAVFICNPNNPTGRLLGPEELAPLLEAAAAGGAMLIVDEAFMDFAPRRENLSLMGPACRRRELLVLYSMTKFFGLPGLRLGAAVAGAPVIERLKRVKAPWSVNALAAVAGAAALQDRGHMAETLRTVDQERDFLFSALASIPGLNPFPSAANFLLLDISGSGMSSFELVEKMAGLGILVRNCANFYGLDDNFVRVAVRTRAENKILAESLGRVAGGGQGQPTRYKMR